MTAPLPTKHLREPTAQWVETIRQGFELESHHDRLLILAAECWDRLQQARELLDEHGLTYVGVDGAPHARPEIAVERDSRLAFARLLRELDLDVTGPTIERRPPALRSNRRLKIVE